MTIAKGIALETLIKKFSSLLDIHITSLGTCAHFLFQKQVPTFNEVLTKATTASQTYGFSC